MAASERERGFSFSHARCELAGEAEPERPDSPGPGGPRDPGGPRPQLTLRGAKAPAKSRPSRTTSRPARTSKTGGPAAAAAAAASKIRNYNIKD